MSYATRTLAIATLALGLGACGTGATGSASPSTNPSTSDACADVEGQFVASRVVLGTANIYGAGHDELPDPGGGGAGTAPPVWLLPCGTTVVSIAEATGTVTPILGAEPPNDAGGDRAGRTDVHADGGISGILHENNGMFLVGVFLTDAEPADPAPETLEFTHAEAFDLLEPEIGQTFFVGDGAGRSYAVPPDATRLFLGFADGYYYQGPPGWYDNNSGELEVTVALTEAPEASADPTAACAGVEHEEPLVEVVIETVSYAFDAKRIEGPRHCQPFTIIFTNNDATAPNQPDAEHDLDIRIDNMLGHLLFDSERMGHGSHRLEVPGLPSGEHYFYCSVPGHAMSGTLVVGS